MFVDGESVDDEMSEDRYYPPVVEEVKEEGRQTPFKRVKSLDDFSEEAMDQG